MIAAGSPGQLWSDAMETALANEARSVPVRDGKTAYELKWKRAPSGVVLPFGCELWTLVEPHLRDKFEARGQRSIFLGYAGEGSVRYQNFTEAAQGRYRVRTTRTTRRSATSSR